MISVYFLHLVHLDKENRSGSHILVTCEITQQNISKIYSMQQVSDDKGDGQRRILLIACEVSVIVPKDGFHKLHKLYVFL